MNLGLRGLVLLAGLGSGLGLNLSLGGCASKTEPVQRQGLFGTFTTYHLPLQEACDSLHTTQEARDNCKRRNQTRIIEPLRGSILVTAVDAQRGQRVNLNPDGSYRINLTPGYYTVCLGKSCSDPIEVRMHHFATYGAQYPKESVPALLLGGVKRSEIDTDTGLETGSSDSAQTQDHPASPTP